MTPPDLIKKSLSALIENGLNRYNAALNGQREKEEKE